MSPDAINGLFALIGGLFVLNSCRLLYRDKRVVGVSRLSSLFFWSYGLWNLVYFPQLGQWWSFAGGLVISSGNTLWLGLAVYYARRAA